MYALFKRLFQRVEKPLDPWDIVKKQLDSLDVFYFGHLYDRRYSMEEVAVMYTSIEEYIALMQRVLVIDTNSKLITLSLYNKDHRLMYLQDFLVTEGGHMLDLNNTLEVFRDVTREYLDKITSMKGEYGERNRELLGKFTQSVVGLVETFSRLQS